MATNSQLNSIPNLALRHLLCGGPDYDYKNSNRQLQAMAIIGDGFNINASRRDSYTNVGLAPCIFISVCPSFHVVGEATAVRFCQ
jgi:hypothetical protein